MIYGHRPCSDVNYPAAENDSLKKNWTFNMYYLIERHVISCTSYSATNERTTNDKLESMMMEVVVAYYSLLSQHYMRGSGRSCKPSASAVNTGHRLNTDLEK
jgi:hypothetical protein